MSFDLNNIVRPAVVGIIGLSISLPIGAEITASGRASRAVEPLPQGEQVLDDIVNNLTKACVDYRISKVDSKLEREAKTAIDDYFGGEVSYKSVCNFVLG